GQWDPKNQRPELWNLYNTRLRRGEHIRVFPLSNWTELDVWAYIEREKLDIPAIYFAHERPVFERDGLLLADNPYITRGEDEPLFTTTVRYRTVGDMTCTGAVSSSAGTVDDGKSTLIGRLLYDSKSIFADQLEAVERTSRDRGEDYTNLALLTDGLRAEREQGITIDVAYRYFATPRRKFIIADTPGHIQYTRNMVTGASTADLAVVLVDARNGLTEQSRRHAFLTTLLRVPHMVLAVNKMDLVGYDAEVFEQICEEFSAFASRLDIGDLTFIPISALHGDNVVDRSANMPWYDGPSLLHHLEHVHIASDRNLIDVRFPVQYVIRPHASTDAKLHDYRGYAGQVAGGVIKPGDEVLHLPSGFGTKVQRIESAGTEVTEAF